MARVIRVKSAAVVLRTVDKREAYFYKNASVPAGGFTDEAIAHAEGLGLIEVIDVEDAPEETSAPAAPEGSDAGLVPAGTDGVQVPEGDPAKSWSHEQIDAWGARQSPPIAFDGNASKDVKLDAIAKLRAAPQS